MQMEATHLSRLSFLSHNHDLTKRRRLHVSCDELWFDSKSKQSGAGLKATAALPFASAQTDKWAETAIGIKWGDKWEEKFFEGIGSRQGETWHVTFNEERWSRTWGEEHIGNGKVHKYGKSTTGESWDIVVDEETFYEQELLTASILLPNTFQLCHITGGRMLAILASYYRFNLILSRRRFTNSLTLRKQQQF